MKKKFQMVFALLFLIVGLTQVAGAEEAKAADRQKPKYKKVSGQVVSVSPTSIVIKGKAKNPVSLAVDDKTDMVGAANLKAGDRASVNYRVEKDGGTATRIKVLSGPAAPATADAGTATAKQKK